MKISVPFFFFRESQRDSSLGNGNVRYCGPELFASMTAQGVNKNVLDSLAVGGMIAVHSAPAVSGAEVQRSTGAKGLG